jgi:Cu+-exporting ATPase
MRISEANVNTVSAVAYTGVSLLAAAVFLAAALAGDYDWVARLGGAAWVFGLSMVVLMPTLPGFIRERVTGVKAPPITHDHEAMLREEMLRAEERSKPMVMVKDPVCGMDVDPESAAASSDYEGQTYYFCSIPCQEEFDAEPEKFAGKDTDRA